MLNPSTADKEKDDPTIGKCRSWARTNGYSKLKVVNLYAKRSSNPGELVKDEERIGPDNDSHIKAATKDGRIIAGWGDAGSEVPDFRNRVIHVLSLVGNEVYCFGRTEKGNPRHPLSPLVSKLTKPKLYISSWTKHTLNFKGTSARRRERL
jgi:hypothetical protein